MGFDIFSRSVEELKQRIVALDDSIVAEKAKQKIDEFAKEIDFSEPFSKFEKDLKALEQEMLDLNATKHFRHNVRKYFSEFWATSFFEYLLVSGKKEEIVLSDSNPIIFYKKRLLEKEIINRKVLGVP